MWTIQIAHNRLMRHPQHLGDVPLAQLLRCKTFDDLTARLRDHQVADLGAIDVASVAVRNDNAKDGLWKVNGKRQVIYAKSDLSISDRFAAANKLWETSR